MFSRIVHPGYLVARCPFSRFQSPPFFFTVWRTQGFTVGASFHPISSPLLSSLLPHISLRPPCSLPFPQHLPIIQLGSAVKAHRARPVGTRPPIAFWCILRLKIHKIHTLLFDRIQQQKDIFDFAWRSAIIFALKNLTFSQGGSNIPKLFLCVRHHFTVTKHVGP